MAGSTLEQRPGVRRGDPFRSCGPVWGAGRAQIYPAPGCAGETGRCAAALSQVQNNPICAPYPIDVARLMTTQAAMRAISGWMAITQCEPSAGRPEL